MEADNSKLRFRNSTMATVSVAAGEYANEVSKYVKGDIVFKPDFRDEMVKTWPDGTDYSCAYRDWGHKINYDMPKIVKDMYQSISRDYSK